MDNLQRRPRRSIEENCLEFAREIAQNVAEIRALTGWLLDASHVPVRPLSSTKATVAALPPFSFSNAMTAPKSPWRPFSLPNSARSRGVTPDLFVAFTAAP